jgi:hypothetical protein
MSHENLTHLSEASSVDEFTSGLGMRFEDMEDAESGLRLDGLRWGAEEADNLLAEIADWERGEAMGIAICERIGERGKTTGLGIRVS